MPVFHMLNLSLTETLTLIDMAMQLHYVVDKASSDKWSGAVGHVTADLVKKLLPPPSDDHLILVCGPPPMMKAISGDKVSPKDQGEVSGILKEVGYTKDQVYKF